MTGECLADLSFFPFVVFPSHMLSRFEHQPHGCSWNWKCHVQSNQVVSALQNFLISVEMLVFAVRAHRLLAHPI